jgi:micrococcal nuclease
MRGVGNRQGRAGSWLALGILMLVAAAPARAETLTDAGTAEVAGILDNGDLDLADGRRVRLAGIMLPSPPLGRAAALGWRSAAEATATLRDVALGRSVALRTEAIAGDRYGRVVAQLWRADGLWLQGELLRRGLARVAGAADDRALAAEMLALEGAARAARAGIWRDGFYAVRSAEEAGRYVDSFQLVEGTVADAAKVKGQVFLNLGPDWHSAFTLRLARPALALFKASGVDPLALKGARIRVRGWLRFDRRPLVEVTHPEQIEALPAP